MKKIHTVLLGGMMAFALAACNTPDSATSTSGSSTMGATGTGNPTVDAQMGVTPNDVQNTGPANATGSSSTPTNTGHTTTQEPTR